MPDRGSACRPAAGLVLALGAMMTLGAAGGGGPRAAPLAPPAGSGPLSETTEVVAVEVPVQVVRDGEPVRGLAAADFEVYEGRKRLPLTGFEVLDLRAGQGQVVAAIQP
ncbi:MAG TPA: hypothetical protein VOA80_18270, partial [Thermoanaerobaculia bacterium]|nr:hypothetical protein [Thermoanaerobaculia bacterium]